MKKSTGPHYTGIPILDEIVIDLYVCPFLILVLIILMPCWVPLYVLVELVRVARQSAKKYQSEK